MSAPGPRPPRLAARLVSALLPADEHGRAILGDLHEEFRDVARARGRLIASLWYHSQVLVVGLGYARPGAAILSDTLQDLRHSLRSLRKNPVFTLSVVGTLALGIGAGTAIFTVVDAVLLRPLPFEDPEQLVRVWASDEEEGRPYLDMLYSDVEVIAEGVESLASVTGFSLAPRTLLTARMEDPEEVTVARATENIFGTFRINPALGRLFDATDVARGEQVIVISHALWQSRYGGAPDALGTMVHLNTRGYEIVGVLPDGLQYPDRADVWLPLLPDEQDDDRELQVFARLVESSSLSAATAELQGVAAGLAEANPETHGGVSAWIQPLQAMAVRDVRTALLAFLGAVGLVLLITCVNTANLLLARAADRRHEVAVRTALGASRSRVLRSYLTESLVLAAFGGVLGLLVGRWALGAILAATPRLPRMETITLDLRVVAVMAIVTTVAGVLFGVGPALHAASTRPDASLRDGGVGQTRSGGRVRLQSGLVTTEIALSTMLAVLAVLLFGTFRAVVDHDRGFQYENLIAFNVDPMHPPRPGDEARSYFERIETRVRALPGVINSGVSSHGILEQRGFQVEVEIEGRPDGPSERATTRIVSDGFFSTAGISVHVGRLFSGDAGVEDDHELVVNERFLSTFLPDVFDPVGTYVRAGWARGHIVGVVEDVSPSVAEVARPIVYVPFVRVTLGGAWLFVRSRAEAPVAASAVWDEIRSVDRYLLATQTVVLEDAVRASFATERFNMLIVVAFAALALGLAAVGIYGVTSYTVTTRRGEIGIRRALGASRPRVASEVVRRIGAQTAVGVVVGIGVAAMGGRMLTSLLVGVEPTDPGVLLSVAALLGTVSLAATALPVLRAVGIAPTEALRGE